MKTRVLDSWAILEWINNRQPATNFVETLLQEAEQGRIRLLMSAINVGEVYYYLRKHHSHSLAESWRIVADVSCRSRGAHSRRHLERRAAEGSVSDILCRCVRSSAGAQIQLPACDR